MRKEKIRKPKILGEKEYLIYLVSRAVPVCIRKADGTNLDNVVLVDFDAGDKRHIVYRKEGDQLGIIPKIECAFISKIKDIQCVTERRRADTKNLPRYLRRTKKGDDRWAFPQHKILSKMQNGNVGIFVLTDGFMYAGQVRWYSQWNILLSVARGKEILLFKHACKRWKIITPKPKTSSDMASKSEDAVPTAESNTPEKTELGICLN